MILDDAVLGQSVCIRSLQNSGSIRRRLLDLGIMEHVWIQPVLTSPSKHMRAYLVKGTMIALRECESSQILVEKRG